MLSSGERAGYRQYRTLKLVTWKIQFSSLSSLGHCPSLSLSPTSQPSRASIRNSTDFRRPTAAPPVGISFRKRNIYWTRDVEHLSGGCLAKYPSNLKLPARRRKADVRSVPEFYLCIHSSMHDSGRKHELFVGQQPTPRQLHQRGDRFKRTSTLVKCAFVG